MPFFLSIDNPSVINFYLAEFEALTRIKPLVSVFVNKPFLGSLFFGKWSRLMFQLLMFAMLEVFLFFGK